MEQQNIQQSNNQSQQAEVENLASETKIKQYKKQNDQSFQNFLKDEIKANKAFSELDKQRQFQRLKLLSQSNNQQNTQKSQLFNNAQISGSTRISDKSEILNLKSPIQNNTATSFLDGSKSRYYSQQDGWRHIAAHYNSHNNMHKKIKEDEKLLQRLNLKTPLCLRNGMKNSSLKRNQIESVGMVSFNKVRNMFPIALNFEYKEDPIFDSYPQLLEFKRDNKNLKKLHHKNDKKATGQVARPVNECYKARNGTSYGLYQRFFWDQEGVPFAGTPGFTSQGPHLYSQGKYTGSNVVRPSSSNGVKISLMKKYEENVTGPTPTQYFGLGRSEINLESSYKFDRQQRILPGEMYQQKPDYNNVLFHKDKGKGVRHHLKGAIFTEGQGMPLEDTKKINFPGPGHYQTQSNFEHTTFTQNAPKYSLPSSGQVVINKN